MFVGGRVVPLAQATVAKWQGVGGIDNATPLSPNEAESSSHFAGSVATPDLNMSASRNANTASNKQVLMLTYEQYKGNRVNRRWYDLI